MFHLFHFVQFCFSIFDIHYKLPLYGNVYAVRKKDDLHSCTRSKSLDLYRHCNFRTPKYIDVTLVLKVDVINLYFSGPLKQRKTSIQLII